jgi:hypothetical protein
LCDKIILRECFKQVPVPIKDNPTIWLYSGITATLQEDNNKKHTGLQDQLKGCNLVNVHIIVQVNELSDLYCKLNIPQKKLMNKEFWF